MPGNSSEANEWNLRKLYQSAEQLKELSDQGKGEKVTKANASSLTYYQKGAWALHILREKVGKEAFNTAVKNYLEQYKFKTATTSNFIAEVEAAANVDWKRGHLGSGRGSRHRSTVLECRARFPDA